METPAFKVHTGRLVPRLPGYEIGTTVIPNNKAVVPGEIHVPIFLAVISAVIYLLIVK
ncbi:MAG: hypothetical protein V1857_05045 [archaeon]